MSSAADVRVVLVTAPDADTASRLARSMVEQRLAACANLVEGVRSIFRWNGAVQEEREVLLIVKTKAERLEELSSLLAREHPYEVPECVALRADFVASSYLRWLLSETDEEPRTLP
jgi:periplasmic divalent cation tolerance protein